MIGRVLSPEFGIIRRTASILTIGAAGGLAAIGCGGGGPEMATADPAGIELNAPDPGNGNNDTEQTPSTTEGVLNSTTTTEAPRETNVITNIHDLGVLAGCLEEPEVTVTSPEARSMGITQIGACSTESVGNLVSLLLVGFEDRESVEGFLDLAEREACNQPQPAADIVYAAGETWVVEAETLTGDSIDAAGLSLTPLIEATLGADFVNLQPNC